MGEKFISFIKSMFSVGDQLRYSLDFLLLLYCLQPATGFDFGASSSKGLFPSIFNLGTHAEVRANTSCGSGRQEQYCTLGDSKDARCGICDEKDPDRAHPAHFILDGTERWWQSPSLAFGPAYHTVTLTINLKQIYQVDYLILTAGQSPRPANWVLERSLDGVNWEAWQYHAMSDQDCWLDYGIEPRKGKPVYKADDEVICTSYYSSLKPIENGEISISLVNGRPGAKGPSKTLLDFTKARYIRLRFQKLHILAIDKTILGDIAHPEYADIARRYFYSIKDVSIGGQCPCHGHASECPVLQDTGDYECRCRHNTCGALCDSCCPMFNQRRWRPGKYISGNECERCQCFGHADECYFDPLVEAERGSLNTAGKKSGGGICLDCRDKTTGVNCERCVDGYYRPNGVSRFDPKPCVPCSCSTPGSQGVSKCYADSELSHQVLECTPCPCSLAGTHGEQCTGNCKCKKHATGRRCDRCKPGFFALQSANPEGCTECFCYGVTSSCDSADYGVEIIDHQSGWMVTDLSGSLQIPPYWSSVTSGLTIAQEDIGLDAYYWQ
ncbi:laminin subunit alpha-1, partial [Eurytemora carolleeae]|uniref:laminin subunit alpha-1 n=1 Tax=Eurytemora carolleeae TaxID=1294199 RepID=UPI000C78AD30